MAVTRSDIYRWCQLVPELKWCVYTLLKQKLNFKTVWSVCLSESSRSESCLWLQTCWSQVRYPCFWESAPSVHVGLSAVFLGFSEVSINTLLRTLRSETPSQSPELHPAGPPTQNPLLFLFVSLPVAEFLYRTVCHLFTFNVAKTTKWSRRSSDWFEDYKDPINVPEGHE